MASYRPAFLCQAGHIDNPAPFALQMGSHTQQCSNGHYPCSADPCQNNTHRLGKRKDSWRNRQVCFQLLGFRFSQLAALDANKAGAEPLDTGKILVTGRLINLAFTPQFCFQRQNSHTIGLHPAITAPLTHLRIYIDPLIRVNHFAPLAPTPFFRSAGLIINQATNPFYLC